MPNPLSLGEIVEPTAAARVAIQGELGSFSHQAALALLPQAEVVPCPLSADVFQRLAVGAADVAVIPIENSLAGSVLEHYDLMLAHDVHIEQEYLLRVRHNLIAPPGVALAQVREVYSHPIALDQCREFFRAHTYLQPRAFYDTAGSVKHVLQSSPGGAAAAIASRQAAAQHGGVLLAEGIEDHAENYTRFLLLRPGSSSSQESSGGLTDRPIPGPSAGLPAGANKVSLSFAVENQPGSLVRALEAFAHQQVNLTKLESRPVPGSPWQYIFYADYQMEELSQADRALRELARHCSKVKELGRYRAAELP